MLYYRSIDDMDRLIRSSLHLIPNVDCIVGVPRSGMLPATLIALYLGKPLISLEEFKHGGMSEYTNRIKFGGEIRKVLVVDDSVSSGHCITQVKNDLSSNNGLKNIQILYAAVYVLESSKKFVDFYFAVCPHLRLFEWNIMDHMILGSSCVDLDGVLCVDPTPEQNDDGVNYLEFIRTAKPKFIPQHIIGNIVTCRLEKYRKETEEWLRLHNVQYKKLYMMDYPDAISRRRANKYAQFKADIYMQTGAQLFIESNWQEAEDIYFKSQKPVYCVDKNMFYGGH